MQQTILVKPDVKGFYESRTGSIQYVVSDPTTGRSAIIDPVLDFDEKSGVTATRSADMILDYVHENNLTVEWILDTHPHADHFSAAGHLSEKTGALTGIGEHVVRVQALWKRIYNWPAFPADGSQWNRLFKDGERFRIGQLDAVFAGPYAGIDHLYYRRRCIHSRHHLHAGLRHGTSGFSRWERVRPVEIHSENSRSSKRNTPLHGT
jgi:glyoxylase-like metal-dependent hydrolase (beta-lactamase superfamily II)